MPNAYVDLQTLKATGGLSLGTGTAYDSRLRSIIEDVSRQIDRYCNRTFFYSVRTQTFDGDGSQVLLVPDCISIGSLREDTNMDGTYETTWASADFVLYPLNSAPTSVDIAKPFSSIRVSEQSDGTEDSFIKGRRGYEIVGTWGYSKVSRDSGLNGTLANSTATALVLSASSTGTLEIGHTVLIDDELVCITGTSGATTATVTRALNGTTGTAHTDKDCNIIEYPGPVLEACFIQGSRLWKRRDSGFASQIGFPESGQMVTWRGSLDPDVKGLLSPYRRVPL